mgnify:CR=1 FL=1
MKSKRSRTYLVSGLTLALIFVAIILVFRDVLPDIVKDLSTVPFWGVLLLLALGFAYEAMESVLCLVIIHHKKPDCTFIDALRVTFLGVFGNITTLGAGTLPMQSFYLYRRGLDAGSGLGIMASEYVLHKISVLIYATVALLLGGDWLEQSASGLARYLLIGYVIGALIVIALTLLYTWDKVLKLVLMLLGKLPHMPRGDCRVRPRGEEQQKRKLHRAHARDVRQRACDEQHQRGEQLCLRKVKRRAAHEPQRGIGDGIEHEELHKALGGFPHRAGVR